jgi:hypothetical protein
VIDNPDELIKLLRSLPPQSRMELLNNAKEKRQMMNSTSEKPSSTAKRS